MKINTNEWLAELNEILHAALQKAERMKQMSDEELFHRKAEGKWNHLEVLEHLNRYGDFYLKEIEQRILHAPKNGGKTYYRTGILGNFSARSMQPKKDGSLIKMKTPKKMDTLNAEVSRAVIDRFIKQQERMLDLLEQAVQVDLTKVKTSISLTSRIKFRLGDTLRFVIYHIQRHMLGIEVG